MLENFFDFISANHYLGLVLLAIAAFSAWNLVLHWQIAKTSKKIKALFAGAKAADLEEVIFAQIKRLRQAERELKELNKFCRYLEKMSLKGIQKVGVLRFNPFKDTGGDQSFSLACLDAQNDGFTLTGLFSREGTRLYTKPLTGAESKYPLTEEEKEAIKIATKNDRVLKQVKNK
ncbi:MAG: DUF4446 family protein [Candidatus Portnoybacteria bacterium]|jgi:hypothetical protein|nr:DUF4446 family protein [Candidatus Portnoybacteria bacterium]